MVAITGDIKPSPPRRDALDYEISPKADVAPQAKIGKGVRIGAFSVIGPHVVLGNYVTIHEHVVIKGRTTLGAHSEVYPFATVGLHSQDKKCKRDFDGVVRIGESTIIREHASIHAPTNSTGITVIGKRTLIMGQCHVAHDVKIGDDVVIVQSAGLGGHVTVDDHAIIGGATTIHQHVRVGKYAIIGAESKVIRDVVPFGLADGNCCQLRGVNAVGLRRHGFTKEQYRAIKSAYHLLFASGLQQQEALDQLRRQKDPDVALILDFVVASMRGLTTPLVQAKTLAKGLSQRHPQ